MTDNEVKFAVYDHFTETGAAPSPETTAQRLSADVAEVVAAYQRLDDQHLLKLEEDGRTIRMAFPFSGVPTPHVVESGGMRYFGNCAWDSFGIVAALQKPGVVFSRCAQSHEPLQVTIGRNGPEPSDWLFHSYLPAARWWQDIVFT